MPAKAAPSVFQLKVTLDDAKPAIWRRFQFLSSMKLCCLHSALQVVMGWTDCHLHQFEKDDKKWGVLEWDEGETPDLLDEGKTQLAAVLKSEGDSLSYWYDFGDNWRHKVVLEGTQPAEGAWKHPVCLAGERRCPPEDVGGVGGYERFLEVILDPKHKDYDQMVVWAGGHFIDEFDVKAANTKLSKMRWPVRHRR
jgi:hypothetical protein